MATDTKTPARPARRKASPNPLDEIVDIAPSLGGATVEQPAKRTRKSTTAPAPVLTVVKEQPAPKSPKSERRNELPHPDAAEAVATLSCSCGADVGERCTAKTGEPTNHVHSNRIKGLDLVRKYEATPVEDKPAAKRTRKAAK